MASCPLARWRGCLPLAVGLGALEPTGSGSPLVLTSWGDVESAEGQAVLPSPPTLRWGAQRSAGAAGSPAGLPGGGVRWSTLLSAHQPGRGGTSSGRAHCGSVEGL